MATSKVNGFTKWYNKLSEDIAGGPVPDEITYKGYTTKNLHHSEDARRAFVGTITRAQRGEVHDDAHAILHALKATDTYMKLNDLHLEQGKPPEQDELDQWNQAHQEARKYLNHVGEFAHHMDYWHNHEHELQGMMGDYTPETAGAEMADSYEPQGRQLQELSNELLTRYKKKSSEAATTADKEGNFKLGDKRYSGIIKATKKQLANDVKKYQTEELTDKTIRTGDKIKVARVIADMLGVENAESMSPELAINTGLRKIKNKRLTPEFVGVVKKMLALAQEVGVKVDSTLIPKTVSEAMEVNPKSKRNIAGDVLRFNDRVKLSKLNQGIVPVTAVDGVDTLANVPSQVGSSMHDPSDDHLRRRKVKYKTEEVDLGEDVHSADYKINPETGRKYRAKHITFKNSKRQEDDVGDQEDRDVVHGALLKRIKEDVDFTEDDLNKLADGIDDIDDVLDAYDGDEFEIVDKESGEIVDDDRDDHVNEEMINEVLTRMARMRARIRFIQSKTKRARKLQLALRTRSSADKINKRARTLAIKLIKQKLAKKPLAQLTVAEKERIEAIVANRKSVVNRLALKLVSRIRAIENDRLTHQKVTK